MARLGNTGVSSLLSSAKAAYQRNQAYNDSMKSYEFDLSPKAQSDYQAYEAYLKGRMGKETDPGKALSLQKTLTSAYRSFNSSEIQRQSLAVDYGTQSNTDKYNKVAGLYQQAIATGDLNLAQSIEGQLARLDLTIQSENAARSGGGGGVEGGSGSASSALSKGYAAELKPHDDALKALDIELNSGKISPNDYAVQMNQIFANKKAVIENGINQGIEKAASDELSLKSNNKYQQISSPIFQEKIQRAGANGGAEDPFALKVNSEGQFTLVPRERNKLDNPLGNIGDTGMMGEQSQYQTGLINAPKDGKLGVYERFRKLTTDPSSQSAHIQGDAATDPTTGLSIAQDPITHKNFYVANGDTRYMYPQNLPADKNNTADQLRQASIDLAKAGGDPTKVPAKNTPMSAGQLLTPNLENIANLYGNIPSAINGATHFINEAVHGIQNPVDGVTQFLQDHNILPKSSSKVSIKAPTLPGALNSVSNLFAHGQALSQQRQQAAAAAQAAASARQRQADAIQAQAQAAAQRAIVGAPTPVRAAAAIYRALPSQAVYAPTIPGSTPAQNYLAASGGGKSNSAIAKGIAGATGYNPNMSF